MSNEIISDDVSGDFVHPSDFDGVEVEEYESWDEYEEQNE